ncbi:MAG: phosphoenolpyruvate carboxykinase (ATP) [Zavarzinella sp.]
MERFNLKDYEITVEDICRNTAPAELYAEAIRGDHLAAISSNGALIAYSGDKTGRSPKDKRILRETPTENDIWWGAVNIPMDERGFQANLERAKDYLNTRKRLYCVDAFAGWDPKYRIKVRVICSRPYHALFMHTMLIRPTDEELANFGKPDAVIYNAGQFPANKFTEGMTSKTSIDLKLSTREMVILGTEYAGEMKKGVFTLMNYFMPAIGVLSMHCSATEDRATGQCSLLFGLSGTGKTTLSADPKRNLIGDDEHCWSDDGIFNIEGGCYAKAVHLSKETEPEIYEALRFGAVLENVVYDQATHKVDFDDTRFTENTRGAYPIEYISNAKIPCISGHPTDVIFLTCDAYGVLPPVSKLSHAQAMYQFISGYTAKVAGTEMGIKEPQATFSPCFGGPFLVWHPARYAELLAYRLKKHHSNIWLVNTGWSGGGYGVGKRMKLEITRAIIDAIHDGSLATIPTVADPIFGFQIPQSCPNVPSEILLPRNTWPQGEQYDLAAKHLAELFIKNFQQYADIAGQEVVQAGPKVG